MWRRRPGPIVRRLQRTSWRSYPLAFGFRILLVTVMVFAIGGALPSVIWVVVGVVTTIPAAITGSIPVAGGANVVASIPVALIVGVFQIAFGAMMGVVTGLLAGIAGFALAFSRRITPFAMRLLLAIATGASGFIVTLGTWAVLSGSFDLGASLAPASAVGASSFVASLLVFRLYPPPLFMKTPLRKRERPETASVA